MVEQPVIEGRNGAHVDAAERHGAALIDGLEGGGDEFAGGGEDDGGVESVGRGLAGRAGPGGAHFAGEDAVALVAGDDVDLDAAVEGHLNGDVRGGAEAVQTEAPARLDAGEPQGAVPDDARAQQRRGVQVGEALRDAVEEMRAGEGQAGIAAVHGPAGERGAVAEVLPAGEAEAALPAGAVEPGDADALARAEAAGVARHRAHHLVAGDERRFAGREFAFDHVEVRAADRAGAHPHQHLAGAGLRRRDIGELEGAGLERRGRAQQPGFHALSASVSIAWRPGRG